MKLELEPIQAIATFEARVDIHVRMHALVRDYERLKRRKGRPPLEEDHDAREWYHKAISLKRQYRMTWEQVADNLGIPSSTLKRYHARFR